MKCRIITISNKEGRVGKTTTAVTLAHGLTLMGKRMLLVDCDSQGQVATFLLTAGRQPQATSDFA
jgi:chromosome partitioning protein